MDNTKLIAQFSKQLQNQGKSRSTIIAYTKDLEQLAESNPNKSLTALKPTDIKSFTASLDLKPKTVSRKINSFRTFYRYLQSKKLATENPAMEVDHPKIEVSKPRVLSQLEYLALRQVSKDNERLYSMIELMLQTGIRIGELARLKVKDVEIKKTKGYLHIAEYSTNPSRRVELNSAAIEVLKNHLKAHNSRKPSDPLFATRDGNHIIIRNIRSSIDRAIDKAGIDSACVNDLRNTFIVHQLQSGVPMEKVTETVGHKSKNTTSRYLEMVDGEYKPKAGSKLVEV